MFTLQEPELGEPIHPLSPGPAAPALSGRIERAPSQMPREQRWSVSSASGSLCDPGLVACRLWDLVADLGKMRGCVG